LSERCRPGEGINGTKSVHQDAVSEDTFIKMKELAVPSDYFEPCAVL
jgi:hypothetical protein